MKKMIHKRLPPAFVAEVLEPFNKHKISEVEACSQLGVKRRQLHRLRKRWLRNRRKKQPLVLWARKKNNFHEMSEEMKMWLDEELDYICNRADIFRKKFNFALLAEEAEKRFKRKFNRNSIRVYALKNGYYHALKSEKGKVYTRFETSGPGAMFQHDSSYHLWLPKTRKKHYVIITKDDYSRMVVGAKLVEQETSFAHLQTVKETIKTYGIPLVYYCDNHSIFRFVTHRGIHVKYSKGQDEGKIQFRRALESVGIGIVYTAKRKPEAKGKVEKIFDYFQRRLPYLAEKHKITKVEDAQKILDELVSYYNEQRKHEETKEIPFLRWNNAINQGKSKLRAVDPSLDLDMIFSIHLKRTTRKDGSILFMGKKWRIGIPYRNSVTVCFIPGVKFMVYQNGVKVYKFHL